MKFELKCSITVYVMTFSTLGFAPNLVYIANVHILAKYEDKKIAYLLSINALIMFDNNALKHLSFSLSLIVSLSVHLGV